MGIPQFRPWNFGLMERAVGNLSPEDLIRLCGFSIALSKSIIKCVFAFCPFLTAD